MATILDNLKHQFKSGGMYIKLIFINTFIFVGFKLFEIIARLMNWEQLFLFASPKERIFLGFIPEQWFSFTSNADLLLAKPWSIFTYMFMHGSFGHLFFNMLSLFFLGKIFEQYLGTKKVLSTYILSGMVGGIIFFITYNIFPAYSNITTVVVGASASVMGIIIGIATYVPNLELNLFGVFRLKLIYIAIALAFLDILSLGSASTTAHFAHLGGALWGFIYMSQYKKGKDLALWFDKLMLRIAGIFKKSPKIRVAHSKYRKPKKSKKTSAKTTPPRNDHDYNSSKTDKQAHLDAILDKIKVGGYECLSTEEKRFLSEF